MSVSRTCPHDVSDYIEVLVSKLSIFLIVTFIQADESRNYIRIQGDCQPRVQPHDRKHGQNENQQTEGRCRSRSGSQMDRCQNIGLRSHMRYVYTWLMKYEISYFICHVYTCQFSLQYHTEPLLFIFKYFIYISVYLSESF